MKDISINRAVNFSALPVEEQQASGSQDFEDRIIGGNETTIDKFPFQVSLRFKGKHRCGGAIISAKHVITSAQCVFQIRPVEITILAGSMSRLGDTGVKSITHYAPHPYFSQRSKRNDIAIVFVATEFDFSQFIQPIKLPPYGVIPEEGAVTALSGWGSDASNGQDFPENLRCVSLAVVGNEKCKKSYAAFFDVTGKMLCANDEKGGKGPCVADHGGPLTLNGVFIGIVTYGQGCGLRQYPSVYTRVSDYVGWISDKISAQ